MTESYYILQGGLYNQLNQNAFTYHLRQIWLHVKKVFVYGIVFLICCVVTDNIFFNCISVKLSIGGSSIINLNECISLGSIFATFGSAVISFLSLTSAHQISEFQEKVDVLAGEFTKQGIPNWKRWGFLPRFSRKRSNDGGYQYFILKNSILAFELKNEKMEIPIPSVEQDFKDLPVSRSYYKLCRKRKSYLRYVQENNCLGDFAIWDCLESLYKNIILYKLSQIGIWIGTSFIINSIVYAFFYTRIYYMHINYLLH